MSLSNATSSSFENFVKLLDRLLSVSPADVRDKLKEHQDSKIRKASGETSAVEPTEKEEQLIQGPDTPDPRDNSGVLT